MKTIWGWYQSGAAFEAERVFTCAGQYRKAARVSDAAREKRFMIVPGDDRSAVRRSSSTRRPAAPMFRHSGHVFRHGR
ncbi:MAG TPA: hypothetical protein VNL91_06685 [Thermoanaerobaculia bacterium]|nr:hypothetical protein [Thermoanaerobaculia bacterium]